MKTMYFKWICLLFFIFTATRLYGQRSWLSQNMTQKQVGVYLSGLNNWRETEKGKLMRVLHDLPDSIRRVLIGRGEKYMAYPWPALQASQYLEFAENGNRSHYEASLAERRKALSTLVVAELLEHQGRFIPQIINGIWATCEESTWALPAHLYIQKKYTPLPNPGENIIDLGVGNTTGILSWTYFLLKGELGRIAPVIPSRLDYELERRVIDPYLQRNDFWWMGFEGQKVNNWNPWVNKNVLLTALLTEEDGAKLDSVVYKTMKSVDHFIDQYPEDGGCDEGPSYWSVAGGSLISYLNLLQAATGGKIDITGYPLISNMGKYIYKMNIDGNYFVDFADAHPVTTPDLVSVFEFGKACHDDTLKQFAAYFAKQKGNAADYFLNTGSNVQKFVDYLNIFKQIQTISPQEPFTRQAWLPDLQVLAIRENTGSSNGLFLAAKGGTNGESHNHNDVGNFIIYLNGKPAIIDLGVGTYTKQTFSKDRYKIFTMQSGWHNLPTINGIMQHAGGAYKAKDVRFISGKKGAGFSLDIAGAYPPEAAVRSWIRTLDFMDKRITLEEKYELKAFKRAPVLSLITPLAVKINRDNIILTDSTNQQGMKIVFDPREFKVSVETKSLDDPSLKHSWGHQIYRILLTVQSQNLKGKYRIYFQSL